jgi:hypothetical protein
MAILMSKSRKLVDLRRRSKRDWYDYAMLALAFVVLLVGVLGLWR